MKHYEFTARPATSFNMETEAARVCHGLYEYLANDGQNLKHYSPETVSFDTTRRTASFCVDTDFIKKRRLEKLDHRIVKCMGKLGYEQVLL